MTNTPAEYTSKMIQALRDKVEVLHLEAITKFWQELEIVGTPIFEPIEGDDQHYLATFIWHGDDHTYNVVLFSRLKFDEEGFALQHLHRLHGTDIWYLTIKIPADVRTTYWLSPNDSLVRWTKFEDWEKRSPNFQHDRFNPHVFAPPSADEQHSATFSILSAPLAPPEKWHKLQPDVLAGTLQKHSLPSPLFNNERPVWVYTPPGYTAEAASYPLLVMFDGWALVHLAKLPIMLDNLIATKAIPPVVAVMMDYAKGEDRMSELMCNDSFNQFLSTELITWVRQNYHVSSDPTQNIIGGISLGGLGAAYAALNLPDMFGKVLSQSGSFWWKPPGEAEPEWFARQLVSKPTLPLRFYIDAGRFESRIFSPAEVSLVSSNRHLRDVLQAKNYPLFYQEFPGYHEYVSWRVSLGDGLIYLLGE